MNSLVSFIVPAYNQARFLPQALESIQNQTYTNWECIIINDGSTDNTNEVAEFWCKKDSRIKFITQENCGVSATRNKGLKLCTGEYIKFLDADDWISYDCLEKSLLVLKNTEDVAITNFSVFDENTKAIVPPYCDLATTEFNFDFTLTKWEGIPIHSGLIPVKLLKGFSFSETIKIYEDWIMWLHIFAQKPNVIFINEPLVVYRKWGKSATRNLANMLIHQYYATKHVSSRFLLSEEQKNHLDRKFEKLVSDIVPSYEIANESPSYLWILRKICLYHLAQKVKHLYNSFSR